MAATLNSQGLFKPVLYVEDDEDDVFFMRHAWGAAGVPNPLVSVKDGQQAIEYLAGHGHFADRERHPAPCLVLLDLKLPIKSGFDVLRWIRQEPSTRSLKVVIVSGSEQEADIALANSLGITEYVVKPSTPGRLQEILRQGKDRWLADGAS